MKSFIKFLLVAFILGIVGQFLYSLYKVWNTVSSAEQAVKVALTAATNKMRLLFESVTMMLFKPSNWIPSAMALGKFLKNALFNAQSIADSWDDFLADMYFVIYDIPQGATSDQSPSYTAGNNPIRNLIP